MVSAVPRCRCSASASRWIVPRQPRSAKSLTSPSAVSVGRSSWRIAAGLARCRLLHPNSSRPADVERSPHDLSITLIRGADLSLAAGVALEAPSGSMPTCMMRSWRGTTDLMPWPRCRADRALGDRRDRRGRLHRGQGAGGSIAFHLVGAVVARGRGTLAVAVTQDTRIFPAVSVILGVLAAEAPLTALARASVPSQR